MTVDRETKTRMFDQLADLEAQTADLGAGALVYCGWKHTSDTPDFVWRWVKTLPDGRILMVDQVAALNIERNQL